jgi:sigma-B regulation protein RsbU (phosphoserine phosphatase)
MATKPNHLTQFIPATTLQRIMDSFAAVTGYAAQICDAEGQLLAESREQRSSPAVDAALAEHAARQKPIMPIDVGSHRMGTMVLTERADAITQKITLADNTGGVTVAAAPVEKTKVRRADALQFLSLLADTVSQMCRQGLQLKHRVEELTTLFDLTTLLAGQRDLKRTLETVAKSVVNLMGVKAAAIRLLDNDTGHLHITGVWNLSTQYLTKGAILLDKSVVDQAALRGEIVEVYDMANDPRMLYPEDARREGLFSMLCVGMVFHGESIGAMRVYTGEPKVFTDNEKRMLRAIAQIAAGAIHNARLAEQRQEQLRIQRQVELAVDVQRRMLPRNMPDCPPLQVAARYEPCFELGGDFYDFIPLENSLGIVVGDVVGKGIAAGLLMASVRASLRAHVQDVYDLDEVMRRVNQALVRDTRDNEFATVFYGTIDRKTLRLTYSSAGHDPSYLLRDGNFIELSVGGMALGVDATQTYDKGIVHLKPGDIIVSYTDGVVDASNFTGEKFGRQRIRDAVKEKAGESARDIVNHILWQVRRFVGMNNRPDDMTVVVVKVMPR